MAEQYTARSTSERPEIPEQDWAVTPESVKAEVLWQRKRLEALEETLGRSSRNSSKPPSSDGFGKAVEAHQRQRKQSRKQGAQPGHEGHSRELYPPEACEEVIDHQPSECGQCGSELSGEDAHPYRHQVVELPEVRVRVTEHRVHRLVCPHCQAVTRASLPSAVRSGYGPRLMGVIGLLSNSRHRQSHRGLQSLLQELFGLRISLGGINRVRQRLSQALAAPVAALQQQMQQSRVLHCDETSFRQQGQRCWLWGLTDGLHSCFQIQASRAQSAADQMLGPLYNGIVVSDRYSAYNHLPLDRRQLCWAHLKRDFQAMAERPGRSASLGDSLLQMERQVFGLWQRVRDGTCAREVFAVVATLWQHSMTALLQQGVSWLEDPQATPLEQKTARTCRTLLAQSQALWTFAHHPGVEPTNNAAERALRNGVIWRKLSLGSQSDHGSDFVARLMSVTQTLHTQKRPVLDYLTRTMNAFALGQPAPRLHLA